MEQRAPRKGLGRGIYLIPSLFTIGNIFCGFYAILSSVKASQALVDPVRAWEATQLFDNASRAIGFAVLLDGLDGRIARLTGTTSDFGVEFDSLADVLSFGIAPAVLAFTWAYGPVPGLSKLSWIASFMFLICGSLRLARFNVQAHKAKMPAELIPAKLDKKHFVGMPIPAGAGMIAAIVHFTPVPVILGRKEFSFGSFHLAFDSQSYAVFMLILVMALGVLMITTLRYSSFKGVGPQSRHPRFTILLIALVVTCIWFYSQWTLLVLAAIYALHGVTGKLFAMLSKRPAIDAAPSEQTTNQ